MADFTVIKESEAPRPARQTGRLAARMRDFRVLKDARDWDRPSDHAPVVVTIGS